MQTLPNIAIPLSCVLLLMACVDKTDDTAGGGDDSATPDIVDNDGDGVGEETDCNDADASIYPGADELCDELDNNCDGTVDEGISQVWYYDNDKDGYGDESTPTEDCAPPEGFVADGTDCQDLNGEIYPGAPEQCDQIDSDCDGDLDDDDAIDAVLVYLDVDGDGYGDASQELSVCTVGVGYVEDNTDCDDADRDTHPGAAYRESATDCMHDGDGDGYGAISVTGVVVPGTDCDDAEALVSPGTTDTCDGLDNDCDPTTNEAGTVAWFDGASWSDLTSSFAAGTRASPASIAPTTSGTMQFCGGSWFATLSLTNTTAIVALDPTTLDGGARRSVVSITGDKLDVRIEGMTLQNGLGLTNTTFSQTVGGGLQCNGASDLTVLDSVITSNTANIGGGLFLDGCTVELDTVEISDNDALYGGGLFLLEGDVVLTDSEVINNTATTTGGGLDVESSTGASLALVDSLVSGNTAVYGGGAALIYDAVLTCSGSSTVRAGIVDNTGTLGGGLLTYFDAYTTGGFTASSCDFGTASGSDDNSPEDVYDYDNGITYSSYGDDASFTCNTTSGCY